MGGEAAHVQGSHLLQHLGGLTQRASCVDDVVDNDSVLALNAADEVHASDFSGSFSLLDDHGERSLLDSDAGEQSLEVFSARDSSSVWRNHHDVFEGKFLLLAEIVQCH